MFVRAAAIGLLALSFAAVVKANVEVLDDESFTALVEVRPARLAGSHSVHALPMAVRA